MTRKSVILLLTNYASFKFNTLLFPLLTFSVYVIKIFRLLFLFCGLSKWITSHLNVCLLEQFLGLTMYGEKFITAALPTLIYGDKAR